MNPSIAFQLYASEQEGWLDTQESEFNRVRKLLEQGYSLADAESIADVDISTLTEYQQEKLNQIANQ